MPKRLHPDINVHANEENRQKLLKIEFGNDIFTPIKDHNSVVYKRIKPICNPKPLLPDINVHAKFEENRSTTTQVRVRKRSADGRTDE